MKVLYVFNCPWHGPESQVFCFRACQEENIPLWQKFEYTPQQVEFNHGEAQALINALRHSTTDPNATSVKLYQS